jgi:hypothetical protein
MTDNNQNNVNSVNNINNNEINTDEQRKNTVLNIIFITTKKN